MLDIRTMTAEDVKDLYLWLTKYDRQTSVTMCRWDNDDKRWFATAEFSPEKIGLPLLPQAKLSFNVFGIDEFLIGEKIDVHLELYLSQASQRFDASVINYGTLAGTLPPIASVRNDAICTWCVRMLKESGKVSSKLRDFLPNW